MMSAATTTQESQMYTRGPATSWDTSLSLLLQKEHRRSVGLLGIVSSHGSAHTHVPTKRLRVQRLAPNTEFSGEAPSRAVLRPLHLIVGRRLLCYSQARHSSSPHVRVSLLSRLAMRTRSSAPSV